MDEQSIILIDINLLLSICGILVTGSSVCAVIWKIFRPLRDTLATLKHVKDNLEELSVKVKAMEFRQQVIGETCWAATAHLADGNSTGEMQKALAKLSKNLMFNSIDD